jgi:hypothetical protein
MTVSCRSSAEGWGAAGASGPSGLALKAAAPQSLQNRLSAGFSLPQALHRHGSGDPQSPQNFLWSATLAPQRGQIIATPLLRSDGRP